MPREDPSTLMSPSVFTSPDFPSDFDPDADEYPPPRHDAHHPHHIRFAKHESFDTSATDLNLADMPDVEPPQDYEFPRRQSVSVSLDHVLGRVPSTLDESVSVDDAGVGGFAAGEQIDPISLAPNIKTGSLSNIYGRRVSIVAPPPDPARTAPDHVSSAAEDDIDIIVSEGAQPNTTLGSQPPLKKRRPSLDPSRFQPIPGSEQTREDVDASNVEFDDTLAHDPDAGMQKLEDEADYTQSLPDSSAYELPTIKGHNPPSSSTDTQTYRDGVASLTASQEPATFTHPPSIDSILRSAEGDVNKYDEDYLERDGEEREPAYGEEDEDDWDVGVRRKEHQSEFQDVAGLDFGDVDMTRTDDDEGMDPMENA
ncbi:hypothetical protein HDV00_001953 [Rhizophlyctis rosea]|nr:hypothetical protein HDV00_001953 [Rhizophlyctis rosea]